MAFAICYYLKYMIRLSLGKQKRIRKLAPFFFAQSLVHAVTGIGNDCSPKSMSSKLHRKQNKTNERNQMRRRKRSKQGKRITKKSIYLSPYNYDIYGRTGITEVMFRELYNSIAVCLAGLHEKRKKKLSDEMSLFITLTWLRLNTPLLHFSDEFKVSESLISRTIESVLQILASKMHFIHMSEELLKIGLLEFSNKFDNPVTISGQIDGTDHPRQRIHPGCLDFFRYDKQESFDLMSCVFFS